ncbi:Mu transposase domain-containing protein [Nonomuraea sp. NPDC050663]|uniref:Mu transposase domain-containing protein n=1 Tax=Nonomuraea sp. NPDC050663 TaxID=3364370 RepID=UPI0037AACAE7
MEAAAFHWVRTGCRAAQVPAVGGRRPVDRLSHGRTASPATAAPPSLRTVSMVSGESRPDIHCSVDRVLYSVPWKYVGKHLSVRMTVNLVQFFYDGDLVKSHVRKPPRQADRPGRLPAGADRLPHAHP